MGRDLVHGASLPAEVAASGGRVFEVGGMQRV